MAKRRKPSPRKTMPDHGGKAARAGAGPLWRFTDAGDGSFTVPDPDEVTGLYFPLCNPAGMRCSVTPDLKGDISTDFAHYLTVPIVTEDLHRSNASRNFWVAVEGTAEPWSATGVGAAQAARRWDRPDEAVLEAGIGWFQVRRTNRELGLEATTTVFVPSTDDTVELMTVTLKNAGAEGRGRKSVRLTATAATPIFGRHADNLRDHRQVTTMFHELRPNRFGVVVKPRIVHDERGHRPNETRYAVMAWTARGGAPRDVWSRLRDFCGEGGSLANPEAVAKGLPAPKLGPADTDGREAVAAMRFAPVTLKPGASKTYIVMHAITDDSRRPAAWQKKFATRAKVEAALDATKAHWQGIARSVDFRTPDADLNNWAKWAAAQLFYRKIYGNSYLPDFGYGRGGRGWRDLWSDLLALFLVDPEGSRDEILNNFGGVRVDGTNATIIGTRPGEFKADRNDIPRVWSDHGAWPWFVLKFYMDQTGDFDVLFTDRPYWKDRFAVRCRERDTEWDEGYGHEQRTAGGEVYRGTVLEHVLLELLAAFYHAGEHGNVLLEGGDWNDTYDNARRRGETVCFTHYYAWDLASLAETIERLAEEGREEVELLDEMHMLLDRLPKGKRVRYGSPEARQKRLHAYMDRVRHNVSGRRTAVRAAELAADLRAKAEFLYDHLRRNEWLETKRGLAFFNGHYDDHGRRVHGDHPKGLRMDLTSQVLPTMFGTATDEQVAACYRSARKALRNPGTGGLRLCTDFKELKLDFGRVTAFIYGFKEHGSIWNQQNMMYMYGLYRRGFAREGFEVFRDVCGLVTQSGRSKVLPCIPSFFDKTGHGGYCYLTGSATWLLLGLLTQMFGLRGRAGDLVIDPKLRAEQFGEDGTTAVAFTFHGRRLRVRYENHDGLDVGAYAVAGVRVNGEEASVGSADGDASRGAVVLPRKDLLRLSTKETNEVVVRLAPRR